MLISQIDATPDITGRHTMSPMEAIGGIAIQSYGADIQKVKGKEKKGHINQESCTGFIGGVSRRCFPGDYFYIPGGIHSYRDLFITPLWCVRVRRRRLTSIWCVSLHVDQIWLLVEAWDTPGREWQTLEKYVSMMTMNRKECKRN